MRVSVFGLGYVGSVTAACFAHAGHQVIGVDVSKAKVDAINAGTSPITEAGIEELMAAEHASGRLKATTSTKEAVDASDIALICVGTPSAHSGQSDLSAVRRVAEQIGAALKERIGAYTVVLRSTVLPGTVENMISPALEKFAGTGVKLQVAVNPEFMREGCALHDFAHPPMTLVGCDDATAATLRDLYAGVDAPFVVTQIRTAEMAKMVSNAFHALKICFANEVGQISAALGADGYEVMRVMMMDKKLNISEAYLKPGAPFGGSCLPKDTRALAYAGRAHDVEVPLLSSIMGSNEAHFRRGLDEVLAQPKKKIGLVGLAFKPGTDDVRESPLLALVETLIGKGFDLQIFDATLDPKSLTGANRKRFEESVPHIATLCRESVDDVIAHADVLLVGHSGKESKQAIAAAKTGTRIIDLTRLIEPRPPFPEDEVAAAAPIASSPAAISPPAQPREVSLR